MQLVLNKPLPDRTVTLGMVRFTAPLFALAGLGGSCERHVLMSNSFLERFANDNRKQSTYFSKKNFDVVKSGNHTFRLGLILVETAIEQPSRLAPGLTSACSRSRKLTQLSSAEHITPRMHVLRAPCLVQNITFLIF